MCENWRNVEIGGQEHIHLINQGIWIKKSITDLGGTIISMCKDNVLNLNPNEIGNLLYFLLRSGFTGIEILNIFQEEHVIDTYEIIYKLTKISNQYELIDLFQKVSIFMTSPLYYTRLGSEIMDLKGVSPTVLKKGVLYGEMLELYIRSGLAELNLGHVLKSIKINHRTDLIDYGEVDIFDEKHGILCEISSKNKKISETNLNNYWADKNFIRILSTKDIESFNNNIHLISYAKLACMVDTKDVLQLKSK